MSRPGAARPQWDGLVVLCAPNSYDGMKMADWHLAQQLSRRVPVLYVDPPLSPLGPAGRREIREMVMGPRLRRAGPGLARLTPVVQPFPFRPGTAALTAALTRGYLRRATAALGGQVRAMVSGWPHYRVFGSCGEQLSVYWAHDDYIGGAGLFGMNAGLLARTERQVAAGAGLLLAANTEVAAAWQRRGCIPALLPFGVDTGAYQDVDRAPWPDDVDLPAPVAGLVGRINDRTDLALLEAIADRGRSLLLVGPRDPGFAPGRFQALTARPNVRWVGEKPFAALPSYLRLIDVGLVPYDPAHPFNRSSFPLKMLEYLAAGRPVVATGLPAVRWLGTGLITVADEPDRFAGATDRWLAEPRTGAQVQARRHFASGHSWASRADDLLALITGHSRQEVPSPAQSTVAAQFTRQ